MSFLAGPSGVAFVALGAAAVTLLAGVLVLVGRPTSERRVHLLLGATAGLLLAVALLDLVPEAIELEPDAGVTMAAGVLALFLVRWLTGGHDHTHGGEDDGHGHGGHGGRAARLAVLAAVALGFHRLVDGFVLPATLGLESAAGLAAAAAILVHQFPDGIAAATLFVAAGWRRARTVRGVAVLAVLTPLGALVGLLLADISGFAGHLVALAAASFIFIALAELLPELRSHAQRHVVGIGFLLGYAGGFLVERLGHALAG
ncbi:MAG TPA: ZIP family metal transporter [Candidatus Thermoplasmatota archaeon]|nr:ZIP family metal transporter [Candidatus Thermoplasmatota archaeon]